jgi:hypothetical protein
MISRNAVGFSMAPNMCRVMESDGFFASIMRSDKKKDSDDSSLPPGIPIPVLPVDYLKSRPDFWVGGQGSYVCPVESDWALWFNWVMNNNDISILTSVKGMNPITGQRTSGLQLEQYKEKCPVHNVKFLHGQLCPECNFKWPEQNYIADPMPFYWDGFRSADGTVRQFYFTEDMMKSVPELVIGKDDTVPAFGFCFYQLKNRKTNYENGNRYKNKFPKEFRYSGSSGYSGDGSSGLSGYTGGGSSIRMKSLIHPDVFCRTISDLKADSSSISIYHTSSSADASSTLLNCCNTKSDSMSFTSSHDSMLGLGSAVPCAAAVTERSMTAEVGIGAGAKISQNIMRDRHSIDEWQEKPAGIIRLYFVFREQFERYVEDGLRDLSGMKEGYLNSIPVGGTNE